MDITTSEKQLFLYETVSGFYFTSKFNNLEKIDPYQKLLSLADIPHKIFSPTSFKQLEVCSLVDLSRFDEYLESVDERLLKALKAGTVESIEIIAFVLAMLESRKQLNSFKKFINNKTFTDPNYVSYISTFHSKN